MQKKYFAAAALPNLVTMFNLFSGFLSILMTIRGHYEYAVWLIFLALLWDSLDGHIARMFHNPTSFGRELDSLADVVSFTVAPCVFAVEILFNKLSFPILLVDFFYLSAGAYRLARFNVRPARKGYFEGLPTPAAAVTLTMSVFASYDNHWADYPLCQGLIAVLIAALSFLMVSEIRYPKITAIRFVAWQTLFFIQLITGAIVFYLYNLQTAIAVIFLLFLLISPFYCLPIPRDFSLKAKDLDVKDA